LQKESPPPLPRPEGTTTQHLYGTFIVTIGVLVLSFDALLIRLAHTNSWNVAFWRGAFMVVSLGLLLAVRQPASAVANFNANQRVSIISACLTSLGSLLFVLSVNHTRVANTVVILSVSPLFAALFTHLFLHEVVSLRTWAAIGVTLVGVAIVVSGSLESTNWLGDLFALLAACNLGGNFTLLRRYPQPSRIVIIGLSGIFIALIALPFAAPLGLSWQSYGVLAVMGLLQIPLALILIAVGTRYLPAPEVSLLLLVETVLGPIWVWLALGEQPAVTTFVGGVLIIATLAVHSWLGLQEIPTKPGFR
jgi:drug/metabolite transporter (DMT)-like permease